LVLAHERRRVAHFNVTAHPTSAWTAQQLREAFPFDEIPRYLLRDRDQIFGDDFRRQVADMTIQEVLSAPRSPWQRAYVERVIGSIRRECLDHVIVPTKPLCAASWLRTSPTITHGAVIFRWRRIRRNHGRLNRQNWGMSLQHRTSADSTIVTNDALPELRSRISEQSSGI
jgi:transposase InsO family protein